MVLLDVLLLADLPVQFFINVDDPFHVFHELAEVDSVQLLVKGLEVAEMLFENNFVPNG